MNVFHNALDAEVALMAGRSSRSPPACGCSLPPSGAVVDSLKLSTCSQVVSALMSVWGVVGTSGECSPQLVEAVEHTTQRKERRSARQARTAMSALEGVYILAAAWFGFHGTAVKSAQSAKYLRALPTAGSGVPGRRT